MRPPIDGAVALVTGASSGIGRELARQLAPRVKTLVLVARRRERLEALGAELVAKRPELEVRLEPADLADRAQTDALVAKLDAVDILVNCAGLGDVGLYERSEWRKVELMIAVDVTALAQLTHRLLPGMIARGRGGVLNVSSGFGLHFMPGFAAYVASKHFVSGFTESLRAELSGTGVVVSQVCPGPVRTEFEEVAVSVPGLATPPFLELSAERCARSALRGFERGRAIILPGLLMKVVIPLGGLVPRPLRRWFLGWIGRRLRRRQQAT